MEVDKFKKYLKEIEPRIDSLKKNNYYLESFLLLFGVLENELVSLVELYDDWGKKLLASRNFNFYISNFRKRKYPRGMTLGQLKDYLGIYCKDFNEELDYFIKLRNKCIHKMFEENISDLEKILKKDFNRFYKLLWSLSRTALNLRRKEIKRLKRNTVK